MLLDNNDQLVEIDRGAFWDLPELSSLSLKSNTILQSINSQAFVGVPNLQLINYDDCQSLDAASKQMLDNITMATTLRQLKQRQDDEDELREGEAKLSQLSGKDLGKDSLNATDESVMNGQSPLMTQQSFLTLKQVAKQQSMLMALSNQQMSAIELKLNEPFGGPALDWLKLKHFYSAAFIVFVIVALKFVFKYTSTRHYMDSRRRRRRVYQSPVSAQHPVSSSTASSCSLSSNGDSKSARSLDSDDIDDDQNISGSDSFMMREQGPCFNILRRPLNRTQNENTNNITNAGDGNNGRLHCGDTAGEIVVHELEVDQLGEVDLHQQQQQQQQQCCGYEQNELVSDCPDCCNQQQQQRCNEVILMPDNNQTTNELDIVEQQQQAIGGSSSANGLTPESNAATLLNQQANLCDNNNSNNATNEILEGDAVQQSNNQDQINIDMTTAATSTTSSAAPEQSLLNESIDIQTQQMATFDLIHNQLVAAGLDYGHANCEHFYQSLGPALQLANLEANFVDQLDY